MKTAVIYARYSSSNQREESIAGQLRECREYAKRNGYTIIREYTDSALSGKTDRRPDFQKMIADSENHAFNAVIVWKLDRFARDRYDAAIYRKRLKDNGVKIFSAMENISDSPEGIILEGLLESMAEYYSANLSENIRRGQYDSAMDRKVMVSCILGYKKGADGRYEIDPATAPIVQRIFREFTSGVNRQQIIDGLNADNLKTARGKEFTPNSIYRILKNDKYVGVYRFRDIVDPEGVPAIVDRETFDRAQTIIKNREFKKTRNYMNTDTYFLVPKIFCGECGQMMTGESAKSKTGKIFKYYSCTGRKGSARNGCMKSRVSKDTLETQIITIMNERILTDDMIDMFVMSYSENRERYAAENTMLTAYRAELADVQKRIGNIEKAIEEGIWTATTRDKLLDLEEQREKLQASILEEEHKDPPISPEMLREYFEDLRTRARTDDECQRTLTDIFLRRLYVFDAQKKNGPFKAVLELSLTGSEGEPVAYETMLSSVSSQLHMVETCALHSNYCIIQNSILISVTLYPNKYKKRLSGQHKTREPIERR